MESGELSCGIFLDLSRAFDCVNHNKLLNKLEQYCIRGVALKWFRSYLSGRSQLVEVSNSNGTVRSGVLGVVLGMPQGSVLGPLLFNIYINDLLSLTNQNTLVVNYADDTNFIIKGEDFPMLIKNATHTLNLASMWFQLNGLILNEKKTKCIFFKINDSLVTPASMVINSRPFEFTDSASILGVFIDDKLKWHHHINFISDYLSRICYMIYVLRDNVNFNVLKLVYFANFVSKIRYGILFWGGSSEISTVFVLQKRALRTMLRLSLGTSCRGHFRSNNFLTVSAMYIEECLLFVWKYRHYFKSSKFSHDYSTRHKSNYIFPVHRLSYTEHFAGYTCLRFYNHLPDDIKNVSIINDYKKLIHAMLCKIEPYTVQEYLSYTY